MKTIKFALAYIFIFSAIISGVISVVGMIAMNFGCYAPFAFPSLAISVVSTLVLFLL